MASRFGDEYVIEEVGDFTARVERILPVREWDSVSYAFTWQLKSDPRFGAYEVADSRWVIRLESQPMLAVFYTIDEAARTVTLTDVRRIS